MGFVAALPRDGATPPSEIDVGDGLDALRRDYDIVHASTAIPEADLRRFVERGQQIGQVELYGALLPYLTLPADRLRGRRVMHWIDNSSACAALVKGYSSAVDSGRIVHALHATLAGLGVRAWFEYVRTDANVSDKPSREDLSATRYALGECMGDSLREELVSEPVESVLPTAAQLDGASSYWLDM